MDEETTLDKVAKLPSRRQSSMAKSSLKATTDLEGRLAQMGWCPHQIKEVVQTYKLEGLSYFATINRHFRNADHNGCSQKRRCVSLNSNMENYITQHVDPTCSCNMVAVAYKDIIKIISNGGVPLVSIRRNESQEIQLRVHVRTSRSRYIAISHVWADGLGNPAQNALPDCQLARLLVQLKSLPCSRESDQLSIGKLLVDFKRMNVTTSLHAPLFWMDTLCIPTRDEDNSLRQKAIDDMASIYAAAVQVLVLDSELLQSRTIETPAVEVLARILLSSWMTRSWTLQEGVLGRECVYQFADAAIDPINAWCLSGRRKESNQETRVSFHFRQDAAMKKLYRVLYKIFWHKLHQNWKSSFKHDPLTMDSFSLSKKHGNLNRKGSNIEQLYNQPQDRFFDLQVSYENREEQKEDELRFEPNRALRGEERRNTRVRQLVQTWNELASRSTTQAKDILVIFANLLEFNIATVTKSDVMVNILFSFEQLPISLFYNTGPRDRPGEDHLNRWVPVLSSEDTLSSTPTMRFVNSSIPGLLLDRTPGPRTPLVYVIEPAISNPGTLLLRVGKNRKYIIICDRPAEDQFDTQMYSSTYIMFPPTTADITSGACFHTTDKVGKRGLRLVFDCPLKVHRCSRSCGSSNNNNAPCFTNATAEYTAREVPGSIKLVVLYTPIPNFEPLSRRTIDFQHTTAQFSHWFALLFNLFLAFMAVVIAIIMSRDVCLPRIVSYTTSAVLVSYLGVLFLLSVVTVFLSPLSYLAWLISFDKDYVEGRLPWWWYIVRQVVITPPTMATPMVRYLHVCILASMATLVGLAIVYRDQDKFRERLVWALDEGRVPNYDNRHKYDHIPF